VRLRICATPNSMTPKIATAATRFSASSSFDQRQSSLASSGAPDAGRAASGACSDGPAMVR